MSKGRFVHLLSITLLYSLTTSLHSLILLLDYTTVVHFTSDTNVESSPDRPSLVTRNSARQPVDRGFIKGTFHEVGERSTHVQERE